VAPGANLLLVISSKADGNDGIGTDAQYLVGTSPVPAQVMSISFGACESSAGSGNVAFWDNLFQTAASEGISVFVSSGDSGASGCDAAFSAPPAAPRANSPNYICSSSYATCVGGTQFADTASPSTYWSSSNSSGYQSVLGYIPEGAWNESTTTSVAGTGGGVSTVIATPSWQTGTGVPSARTGRYTPDVSFTASGHDGYFACMAAISGGGCVTSGGSFGFVIFSGTSASAPGMAGVAALLDQKLGSAQGSLNPQIYSLAASAPASFHDATVASSGVGSCSATTASLCNNSMTLLSGSSAQAGFTVGAGFDEATGLGSLDVAAFLNNYNAGPPPPTATSGTASAITLSSATLSGTVNPNGLDTRVWFLYGTDNTLSGASQSASQDIGSGSATTAVSANLSGLISGTPYYFQVVAQSSAGTSSGAIQTFATASVAKTTPTITWATPAAINYGTALSATQLNATAKVTGVTIPGTLVYSPSAGTVLKAGSQTLNVNFTPTDTTTYNSAFGTVTLTVNKVTPTVTWSTPAAINYGTALTATQLNATASVAGTLVYNPAATTVLTAGTHMLNVTFTPADTTDYNSPAPTSVQLTVNKATPVIAWANPAPVFAGTALSTTQLNATSGVPGTFVYSPPPGTITTVGSTILSTTFTPTDTTDYNTAATSVTLIATPFAVSGTTVNLTAGAATGNTSTITVTPGPGFTGSVTLTANIDGPAGFLHPPTVTFATSPVAVSSPTAATTTMTIATTASQTTPCVAVNETPTGIPWYAKGGTVMACVLLFGIAPKRRKWRTMLGALILLLAFAGGMVACGGSKSLACASTITPGTTAGSYTITVTGTSGATAANSAPIALTVN
jgi:subtilase family serine protease